MNINDGELRHLTLLHLYTGYKITNKDLKDLTPLQYKVIMEITNEIMKFKKKNKPMVVI